MILLGPLDASGKGNNCLLVDCIARGGGGGDCAFGAGREVPANGGFAAEKMPAFRRVSTLALPKSVLGAWSFPPEKLLVSFELRG